MTHKEQKEYILSNFHFLRSEYGYWYRELDDDYGQTIITFYNVWKFRSVDIILAHDTDSYHYLIYFDRFINIGLYVIDSIKDKRESRHINISKYSSEISNSLIKEEDFNNKDLEEDCL